MDKAFEIAVAVEAAGDNMHNVSVDVQNAPSGADYIRVLVGDLQVLEQTLGSTTLFWPCQAGEVITVQLFQENGGKLDEGRMIKDESYAITLGNDEGELVPRRLQD